uniref:Protein kinase domain-containing protein n=1 Tax=Pygocentrus nattereri TaxID=42514 RepID=A0A3B4D4Z4_PYGNA
IFRELLDLKRLLSFVSAPFSNAKYRDQRLFSGHPHHGLFLDIFTALIKNRLHCSENSFHIHTYFISGVWKCFYVHIKHTFDVFQYMDSVAGAYLENGDQALETEQLVTMMPITIKLTTNASSRVRPFCPQTLVKLLSARDSNVLLGALLALTTVADGPECREKIGELSVAENLLIILQEYDMLSKRLSAELLRLLCPVPCVREQVCQCEGVPVLLSMLHADDLKLLWSTVWVLVQLCQDPHTSALIRAWGGVQQLLHILHGERVYVSDRSSIETLSSANAAGRLHRPHVSEELSSVEAEENTVSLYAACCAAVTELVLDDTAAHLVVQENGVYVIGKMILPQGSATGPKAASLQCYAFRTLRFLFSMERNRHLFKRLFPPELFETFIDIGHYVRDISAYKPLQEKTSLLSNEELDGLRERIEAVNQNRPPIKVINGYSILDHLGSGAFGSVFKVRKQGAQNCLALKEVNLHNPAFGNDKKSRDSNVEKIVSELTIIKEQMAHPNIVKYFKTFLECDRLYIVMELVEGAPLADHFSSLKEKQQTFTEDRVWNIFIQMCLALRYLHKEKRIVHRDLTPNNIMLGERDKVTITDFGLAKQKQETSKLMSVVGTILYSCPEIVKSEPYGEKADVWAAGCILYQMVTLRPPFYSTNMLSLATKIVEAAFEPVEDPVFSDRVTDMIKWCLTPNPDLRPDIVEVGSRICDLMMRFMDSLSTSHVALEKRAERDRRRAQKYCLENNRMKIMSRSSVVPQVKFQNKISGDVFSGVTNHASPSGNPMDESGFGGSCLLCVMSYSHLSPLSTASAGIYVSQRKVRQIDDPNLRLLGVLHKIIFITQLPPGPQNTFQRRTIERFKKSLFQCGSSPFNLKMELNKVTHTLRQVPSPGNRQTQTRPSDFQTEKRDWSFQRTRLHCSRVQWWRFTPLHSTLCIALGDVRLGCSCSAMETHSMKLSTLFLS